MLNDVIFHTNVSYIFQITLDILGALGKLYTEVYLSLQNRHVAEDHIKNFQI